jgi:hypothetical protein
MSRKEIGLSDGALLVVGWDPPLATFYAQVFKPGTTHVCTDSRCSVKEHHIRRDCQDELIELWLGMDYGELTTLEALVRVLGDAAASLSEATKAELRTAKQLNE